MLRRPIAHFTLFWELKITKSLIVSNPRSLPVEFPKMLSPSTATNDRTQIFNKSIWRSYRFCQSWWLISPHVFWEIPSGQWWHFRWRIEIQNVSSTFFLRTHQTVISTAMIFFTQLLIKHADRQKLLFAIANYWMSDFEVFSLPNALPIEPSRLMSFLICPKNCPYCWGHVIDFLFWLSEFKVHYVCRSQAGCSSICTSLVRNSIGLQPLSLLLKSDAFSKLSVHWTLPWFFFQKNYQKNFPSERHGIEPGTKGSSSHCFSSSIKTVFVGFCWIPGKNIRPWRLVSLLYYYTFQVWEFYKFYLRWNIKVKQIKITCELYNFLFHHF